MAKHKLLHRVQLGARFVEAGEVIDLSPEDARIVKAVGAAAPCDDDGNVLPDESAPEAPESSPPGDASTTTAATAPQVAAAGSTSRAEKKKS